MGYDDDVEVKLLPDTIKLIHMTEERKIIPSKAVSHNLDKWPSGKIEFKYIKIYEPKLLPKKIIESIYLEIIVDGKKVKIEYEFPIEKKLEGTFWDAMKGI